MKIIDITKILSKDLTTRSKVNDLMLYVQNCKESEIVIDFRNVMFATRCFMDEFYNQFLKDKSSVPCKIEITNIPEDILVILDSVSRTQNIAKTIKPTSSVRVFNNVDELLNFLKTIPF